jgi:cobyrinic acid a,c-diamide synthase
MGLFDGHSATAATGSTAEIAGRLGAPVVLVIDASAVARTAAAIVHGLNSFDPDLRLGGVVLNRVAGPAHYEICRTAIESMGVPVCGWIADDPALSLPERHLGLVLAGEQSLDIERLTAAAAETLDLEALVQLANTAPPLPAGTDPLPDRVSGARAVIAVARDRAFDFYYEDNLDLLHDLGAEVLFFSPLEDETLPADTGALYLGGGYPELHAERLFVNLPIRRAIRDFAAAGGVVYGECGGLMYLSQALVDASGAQHRMVGLVPAISRMRDRVTLGYREVVALRDSPLATAGQTVRGHEFHFSVLDRAPAPPAYRRVSGEETEGIVTGPGGNVLASYIHLHFGTDPGLAKRLVAKAERGMRNAG